MTDAGRKIPSHLSILRPLLRRHGKRAGKGPAATPPPADSLNRSDDMQFMVIMKATPESEAGAMPEGAALPRISRLC